MNPETVETICLFLAGALGFVLGASIPLVYLYMIVSVMP